MTKNGLKTMIEQDFDNSLDEALAELVHRGELPKEIQSVKTMRQRVPVLLDNGEYELLSTIATALTAGTLFYRQDDSYAEIIPIKSIDDVLDLFEEDKEEETEMTLENIVKFIEENNVSITELFDEEEIRNYVEENCDIGDVYSEDAIIDYVKDNHTMDDLYDWDDIRDFVTENVDINDWISFDWRY